jgi:hypothetical protein
MLGIGIGLGHWAWLNNSPLSPLSHAYRHRKEGDLKNAHYWYQRSGQPEFSGELSQEWEQITSVLLKKVNTTYEC